MGEPDLVLANYMLASIHKDLGFLKEHQYLSAQTYNEILALLPTQVTKPTVQNVSQKPPLPTRKSATPGSETGAPPVPAPRDAAPKLPARRAVSSTSTGSNQEHHLPTPAPRKQPQPSPRLRPTPAPRSQTTPAPTMQPVQVMPTAIPEPAKIDLSPPPAYSACTNQAPSPANTIATVEAIYDYEGDDPTTDLSFRCGDVIHVTEYVNNDWWRGELNGRSGIFPQNHVKKLETPVKRSPPPKPVPINSAPTPPYSYPPPPTAIYHPPPPAQVVGPSQTVIVTQAQPTEGAENNEHGKVANMAKKFGGHVGTAALWGFGATVGSEAARAIF